MADAESLAIAVARNGVATIRIADLANGTHDLSRLVHGQWTVAAKLGHLAFWDRFVLGLLDRWEAGLPTRIDSEPWHDDVLNDAVLGESLALEPSVVAGLAVAAARAVDERLAGLHPSLAGRLEADAARPETDANWLVHRYRHREEHLNDIDAALKAR